MKGENAKVSKKIAGFSDFEREAMKEHAQELLGKRGVGEEVLLAKLAVMPEPDRSMGERIHKIITKNAPSLVSKTWYGMPAYANGEGRVICFFQGAAKFKARYSTLGFNDPAKLDEGNMWPTSFAIKKLTPKEETLIIELVQKATGK